MFANAVKLFSFSGFDIKLDPSWALIAALITWSLSQHYFPSAFPDLGTATYLVMAVTAMLLFFASLLLHELAHSVVARRFGLKINSITLFLFGGVAEIEDEPQSAGVEFWVALAGPAMSFALAFGFWILKLITGLSQGLAEATVVLSYLATINLVLALFNLVPAFPLDGGRVLRAFLWNKTGDSLKATETAAKSGAVFAYVLMALGVFALFQGALISALWQIMIGGFLLAAARASYQQQLAKAVFGNRTVSAIMHRHPVTVPPEMSLTELGEKVILHKGISFVPVVENGVLLGHIDQSMLGKIDREHWASMRVDDIFVGVDATTAIPKDMPVQELLARISSTGTRKFLVVSGHHLLGVISLADLIRYLNWPDHSRAA